jgi:hypothetical protein
MMKRMLGEVGDEASEEPEQPLSQKDDPNLLTAEGAEDAPSDENQGHEEEITETETEDQMEFKVAESEEEEAMEEEEVEMMEEKDVDINDLDNVESDLEKVDEEEKLDEWANDAGKKGTDTSFEQDIDFMTKVISGGLNKQKSTGQTTIPVIAGQEDRMGYNGADLVKEGSVMSSDGFATILNKLDSLK